MTKADVINEISRKTNLTKKDIGIIVNAFLNKMDFWLKNGEHLELRGFGSFGTKIRKSRFGINPQNKEKILIPERKVVYFKPGKELKENIKYAQFKENEDDK